MLAASLLAEAGTGKEATRLLSAGMDLLAPDHLKAELANIVWKSVLLDRLPVERVDEILDLAAALPITYVPIEALWRGAVARSIEARHPVYDTLFVELAVRESALMASYDAPLRRRFPDVVKGPPELLRGT